MLKIKESRKLEGLTEIDVQQSEGVSTKVQVVGRTAEISDSGMVNFSTYIQNEAVAETHAETVKMEIAEFLNKITSILLGNENKGEQA